MSVNKKRLSYGKFFQDSPKNLRFFPGDKAVILDAVYIAQKFAEILRNAIKLR
jgi:hypothetical protein